MGDTDDHQKSACGPPPADLTAAQVGEFLLANNFLLSAFELCMECQDADRGDEVQTLQETFSDPVAFPPDQAQRFQASDALSALVQQKEREEALSLAQYKLRLADEDTVVLKRKLEDAAVTEKLNPPHVDGPPPGLCHVTSAREVEKRLAALVSGYLLEGGYKLTALTFEEESHGRVASPGIKAIGGLHTTPAAEAGATSALHLVYLDSCALAATRRDMEAAQRDMAAATAAARDARTEAAASAAEGERLHAEVRALSTELHQERQTSAVLRAGSDAAAGPAREAGEAACSAAGVGDLLAVLTQQLPAIVPNLLIQARGEMLPLLEGAALCAASAAQRAIFLTALFGLVRRPNEAQRDMILGGVTRLAAQFSARGWAGEVWGVVAADAEARHPERRGMVAEACAALSPHLAAEVLCAAVLPLMLRLAADDTLSVRHTVACSLAAVMSRLTDVDGAYEPAEAVLVELASDGSQDLADVVMGSCVPMFLKVASKSDRLLTCWLPTLIHRMRQLLEACPYAPGAGQSLPPDQVPRIVGDLAQRGLQTLLGIYSVSLGPIMSCVLATRPAWARSTSASAATNADPGDDAPGVVLHALGRWLASGPAHSEWDTLSCVVCEMVVLLTQLAALVAPLPENDALRRRFTHALRATCIALGPDITLRAVAPIVLAMTGLPAMFRLSADNAEAASPAFLSSLLQRLAPSSPAASHVGRTGVLPHLLTAVLPKCGPSVLSEFLNRLSHSPGAPGGGASEPWAIAHSADAAVALHCAGKQPDLQPVLLSLLWELVVAPARAVRHVAALLAKALAGCLGEEDTTRHLLPVLVTLSAASDRHLIVLTVHALAEVSRLHSSNSVVLSKVHDQIDNIVTDGDLGVHAAVVRALAGNLRHRANTPQLEFLLQKVLYTLASMRMRLPRPETARDELLDTVDACCFAVTVVEACELQDVTLQLHLLAAVDALQREADLLPADAPALLAAMKAERTASSPGLTQLKRAQPPQRTLS